MGICRGDAVTGSSQTGKQHEPDMMSNEDQTRQRYMEVIARIDAAAARAGTFRQRDHTGRSLKDV
jgi:hypothetical protein